MKKYKTASSVIFIGLFMILAVTIFSSWVHCQESFVGEKGRWTLRYTQQDSLWKKIDYGVFYALNGTMKDNPVMQTIWGVTNHRAFDLIAAAWMILIFLIYYIRNSAYEERIAIMQFGLYMAGILLVVTLASELSIQFHRFSPTETEGVKEKAIILSDLQDRITWKVKTGSNNSFPGDHATVLMLIGSFIIYRLRSWYGVAAALGMVAFMLPRLAGGGHWLSDIVVGSLSFYLLFFPLFIFKPLQSKALVLLRPSAVWIHRRLGFLVKNN